MSNNAQFSAYHKFQNLGTILPTIRVQTYWQLGERIVREELKNEERAGYGKYLITNLARDLDIIRQELYRIVKFYRLYEIVATVSRQLSWSHYELLIEVRDDKQRAFYQNKAAINSGVFEKPLEVSWFGGLWGVEKTGGDFIK